MVNKEVVSYTDNTELDEAIRKVLELEKQIETLKERIRELEEQIGK